MANEAAAATLCSICWEEASETCGRSIVRLQCSHLFHLDCIGSAFNATGIMQCPNCREVENGLWMRFENNEDMDEDSDEDERTDDDLPDMIPQQCVGNNNWGPGFQRVTELPLPGHQDCPIFSADHHLYGPPMISEISTSQVIFHGPEPIHPAVFTPMCGNFIGANQPFVPSAAPRAAHCDAGGLPNFVPVGHRAILQPGRRSNGLQGRLPAEHVPSPPLQVVHHVPALNSTIHNYHAAAVPGDSFLSFSIQNNLEPEAANLVHCHYEEEIAPIQIFPYDMGPFQAPHN